MINTIIILGSSRSYGNTRKAITKIVGKNDITLIDLNQFNIKPYDYEYLNQSDDFIPLIERIMEFDIIVLATPVYWYTMSATMKIFIDRITDLLDIKKDLGRKLRDKKLFVIACFGISLPKGFEDAFSQTCEYLGIEYLGTSFIYIGDDEYQDEQFTEHNCQEIIKAQSILKPLTLA